MKAIINLRRQAAESEVKWSCLQSSLKQLVKKCTAAGKVHDAGDVLIAAVFVDIYVDNAPAPEKMFSQ